jgi:5'-nucleotidase/UDP-sugar diphosphatase
MTRHVAASILVCLVSCVLLAGAFELQQNDAAFTPSSISFASYLSSHTASSPKPGSPNAIHVTVLHINDLYELIPSGSLGGVARVKSMLMQLLELNDMTFSVLAGDLFSPSALSTVPIASLGGASFDGAQMVSTMNSFGLDYATIGNHETDVSAGEFASRLAESAFPWLCLNAQNRNYSNLGTSKVVEFAEGNVVATIGIWGMTLDSNNKEYQSYANFSASLDMAAAEVAELRNKSDVVIALTHLPYWHDQTLVATVPGIDIVMGGHEHRRISIVADGVPPIYKADSNVHSAWIHDLYIDTTLPVGNAQRLVITSNLIDVDSSLTDDVDLATVIDGWVQQAFQGFTDAGFQPAEFLATITDDLVGTNDVIFAQETVLTQLFNLACLQECTKYASSSYTVPPIDATIFNAGAIRIDDTIPAGTSMIQYDAIRISPYLNAVLIVNMTGALLKQTLDVSQAAINSSQYLHSYPNITIDGSAAYLINGVALDVNRWYTVGVLKFLLKGKAPYSFLQPAGNTQLQIIAGSIDTDPTTADVRKSLISQIGARYTPPSDDDSPRRILGLKVWIFVFVLIGSVCLLGAVLTMCVRFSRARAVKRQRAASWQTRTDQRSLLASQYAVQNINDDSIYASDV